MTAVQFPASRFTPAPVQSPPDGPTAPASALASPPAPASALALSPAPPSAPAPSSGEARALAAAPVRARFVQRPEAPTPPAEVREVPLEATVAASAHRAAGRDTEGYVLFAVGATSFAVAVSEVREVVRAARLDLLPDLRQPFGRGVALVDARGRAVPVIDLRGRTDAPGDVLLPVYRHQVGLVVDRVLSVRTPLELVPEHEQVPDALPSYARGVLRPVDGGDPVLLVELPDAAELEADGRRSDGTRLGADVLGGSDGDGPASDISS